MIVSGASDQRLNLAQADQEEALPFESCRRAALLSLAEGEQRIPLPRGLMITTKAAWRTKPSNSGAELREVQ